VKRSFARILSRLHAKVHAFEERENAPGLGAVGPGSVVATPSYLLNPDRLFVGRDTYVHPYCRLEVITANPHLDGPALPPTDARIEIGDRVVINSFSHLGAMARIVLEDDVGIASGVCIEDHHYLYEGASLDRPLKKQPFRVAEVVIESGAMIGEHAVILPGVRIGKNSWVGANAVVTEDVPPYSIVAGVPARVIRRMDPASGEWLKLNGVKARR
jgi:acetyltransferase-like isoleucine patch superfamily enzyme